MKTNDKSHGVVTNSDDMVSNNGGVTILRKSFEMLGLPVMQSSFAFTDIEESQSQQLALFNIKCKILATRK